MWFKEAKVKTTTVPVAQIYPIPAVYAYDVLMEAIPAHVLWERIKVADLLPMKTLELTSSTSSKPYTLITTQAIWPQWIWEQQTLSQQGSTKM